MKRITVVLLALIMIMPAALPARAYSPPAQGTDNATEVIIWHGDDMTVNVDTSGIENVISDESEEIFLLLLTGLIVGLALWQRKSSPFLALLGVAPAVIYGLTVARDMDTTRAFFVDGATIAVFGFYLLYSTASENSVVKRIFRKQT